MAYQIVENDVRLLRRMLVCYNIGDSVSGDRVREHLSQKGLNFVLGSEIDSEERRGNMFGGMPINEAWLANAFGFAVLIDYQNEVIFLNSMWANPRTLYVKLVKEVPELDKLGTIVYLPFITIDIAKSLAEVYHKQYAEFLGTIEDAESKSH